jgi:hypothetical protein
MREYDIALKNVLRRPPGRLLAELTGLEVTKWHNLELAETRARSADRVGSAGGSPAAIRRQFGRFPAQLVLYVGPGAMRMRAAIEEAGEVSIPSGGHQRTGW